MKKGIRNVGFCLMIVVLFWCGTLLSDRQRLHQELIRLHVVANSDSPRDQALKLQVRDAVTDSLREDLNRIADVSQAKDYLQAKLPYIQSVAYQTLQNLGCETTVEVSLCQEEFDTRDYDTFSLPAGIYNALRIVIGEGEGKNWWCVVFPTMCFSAAGTEYKDVTACAGFPESLQGALAGEQKYELRFGLLDAIGKLENMLFQEKLHPVLWTEFVLSYVNTDKKG